MGLDAVRQNLAYLLGDFSRLAHVDGCSLEFICRIAEREVAETAAHLLRLKGSDKDPALTLLSGTTGTAETMDVGVALTGETHLDDVGDFWEIHTTSRHIRREEDTRLGVTEVVCSSCSLSLAELGVDLESTEAREGSVTLETTAELVEDRCGECDFGGAVEIDDGLERAGATGLGLCLFLENEFVDGRNVVLKTIDHDHLLGNTLVRGLLVFVDALGEVEARAHSLADQVHNIARDSGREHEVLAFDHCGVRQKGLDVVNLLLETVV